MKSSDNPNARVVFFQVDQAIAKLRFIADTASAHFKKKELFILFVEDEKAQSYVDELLWKIPETRFLPHIATDETTSERIAITKSKTNVNGAHFAFNLCATPLLLPGFKIIYDFEDLSSPNKKNLSSTRFEAYKQAQLILESR